MSLSTMTPGRTSRSTFKESGVRRATRSGRENDRGADCPVYRGEESGDSPQSSRVAPGARCAEEELNGCAEGSRLRRRRSAPVLGAAVDPASYRGTRIGPTSGLDVEPQRARLLMAILLLYLGIGERRESRRGSLRASCHTQRNKTSKMAQATIAFTTRFTLRTYPGDRSSTLFRVGLQRRRPCLAFSPALPRLGKQCVNLRTAGARKCFR
jgi:hypothetical protein